MIELTGYRDKHEYVNKHGVRSVVYLMDCMYAMAQMGEKEFSLACVDPPYGIGAPKQGATPAQRKKGMNRLNSGAGKLKGRVLNNSNTEWDNAIPTDEYFDHLFMVCDNQIIWGGNYFPLPPTRCVIAWDKMQPWENFSQWEMAWTSFDSPAALFKYDNRTGDKQHPTQKPIDLYDWVFHRYAKPSDTIFDSHLGSGSSRIAADKHNLPFLGTETDDDYFYAHCKRFDRYTAQLTLF